MLDDRRDLVRAMYDEGYEDVLVISPDSASDLLTERRLELLEHLEAGNEESVSEVAHTLGRDPSAVSDDLNRLFVHDVIEFERDDRRKIPRVKHEHIVIEPLI